MHSISFAMHSIQYELTTNLTKWRFNNVVFARILYYFVAFTVYTRITSIPIKLEKSYKCNYHNTYRKFISLQIVIFYIWSLRNTNNYLLKRTFWKKACVLQKPKTAVTFSAANRVWINKKHILFKRNMFCLSKEKCLRPSVQP